jgi:hypothetical protein
VVIGPDGAAGEQQNGGKEHPTSNVQRPRLPTREAPWVFSVEC